MINDIVYILKTYFLLLYFILFFWPTVSSFHAHLLALSHTYSRKADLLWKYSCKRNSADLRRVTWQKKFVCICDVHVKLLKYTCSLLFACWFYVVYFSVWQQTHVCIIMCQFSLSARSKEGKNFTRDPRKTTKRVCTSTSCVCVCACIHVCVLAYMYVCLHTWMCACMYVCVLAHKCVCMCVYIHNARTHL